MNDSAVPFGIELKKGKAGNRVFVFFRNTVSCSRRRVAVVKLVLFSFIGHCSGFSGQRFRVIICRFAAVPCYRPIKVLAAQRHCIDIALILAS